MEKKIHNTSLSQEKKKNLHLVAVAVKEVKSAKNPPELT